MSIGYRIQDKSPPFDTRDIEAVIVGSVDIIGCHEDEDGFVWELASPRRYRNPLVPHGVPQPDFGIRLSEPGAG